MFYFDVHTHQSEPDCLIGSDESKVMSIIQNKNSIGIHPWALEYLNEDKIKEVMHSFVHKLENNENKLVKAIGECGIDKLCTSSIEWQKKIFIQHVLLSEQFKLPLIIHGVKAQEELLQIRKLVSPTQSWIWHGFRGKSQQLNKLINAGFYISFGLKYNKESLLACPLERMLLETDDSSISINEIYDKIASDLILEKEDLTKAIMNNYSVLFSES